MMTFNQSVVKLLLEVDSNAILISVFKSGKNSFDQTEYCGPVKGMPEVYRIPEHDLVGCIIFDDDHMALSYYDNGHQWRVIREQFSANHVK